MENNRERFFNIHRTLMIHSGLWNPKDFPKRKRQVYEFYSRIREVIAVWFILSRFIAGILFIVKGKWQSLMNNLLISLALILIPFKYVLCRSSRMNDILDEAARLQFNWSYAYLSSKKIYNIYKRQSLKFSVVYLIYSGTAAVLVSIATVILIRIKEQLGDTDVDILLFSYWSPYDRNQHQFIAYGLDLVGLTYVAGYHAVCDLVLFGLFAFGIANFRILQSNFRCSKTYIEGIKRERGISFRKAEMMFIEDNIIHHRNAIRFLKKVDEQIASFVIFDFLSISIKLSILIYQLLNEISLFPEYMAVFAIISTITIEMFAYYWYANEIQLQSGYLTRQAIFDSDFDEFSPETRRRLAFMIQRAQTPSQISIGFQYVMNIDTLIKVLKTIYTYICLFNTMKEGNKSNY